MAEVLPARLFATRILGTIDIRENSFRTLHELDGCRVALVGASRNIANSDFEYAEIELSPRGLRDLGSLVPALQPYHMSIMQEVTCSDLRFSSCVITHKEFYLFPGYKLC